MKISTTILFLILITSCGNNTNNMDNDFSPYPRVRQAYGEKGNKVKQLLVDKEIDTSMLNIFIRAFKTEQILEIWGKNSDDENIL